MPDKLSSLEPETSGTGETPVLRSVQIIFFAFSFVSSRLRGRLFLCVSGDDRELHACADCVSLKPKRHSRNGSAAPLRTGLLSHRRLAAISFAGGSLQSCGRQSLHRPLSRPEREGPGGVEEPRGCRRFARKIAVALQHLDDPTIVGWMQPDEPDNAQEVRDPATGKRSYGPPVKPEKVVADYQRMHDADPTRPVLLNLGPVGGKPRVGAAGRRASPRIISPTSKAPTSSASTSTPSPASRNRTTPTISGSVPKGVDRLQEWTGGKKITWNALECTHIHDAEPPGDAAPGARRGMDVDHPRQSRDHLVRPSVSAEVRRARAAG